MAVTKNKKPTKSRNLEAITEVAEAYGSAVRAGLVTPCLQDENAFRKMLGLQEAPAEVVAWWKNTKGVRTPVTLQLSEDLTGETDDND